MAYDSIIGPTEEQCRIITIIVSRAIVHFTVNLIKNELLTKHQDKPSCLPSKITTLALVLVIIIAAIVYHLYQDNGNISLFDEYE
ncbi:MAG: hypothetical protein DRR16_32230 [Candidatus Parabeggiatoa sp. nov. 3]|nr:MAG: hypothetical protein DRR00_33065 [Gammaproteobacteria bacterium]RKZ51559.1 MAG: hypothetical protein DRQ99_33105 [Gammaproteobacteria bacterium]RKZ74326.1 MAG: hypothetical protein DRR16_32230 [Gammaproteobacteria bacterium]